MFSGVPVSQVQEDSVRDEVFKHRKLAQMACRSVPDAPPQAGCWEGRAPPRPSSLNCKRGQGRSGCHPPPPSRNNEIKAWLPVSRPPGFSSALCRRDRGCVLHFSQTDRQTEGRQAGRLTEGGWKWGAVARGPADSTSREQVCSVACLASLALTGRVGLFQCVAQLWISARLCVGDINVAALSP